MRNIKYVFPAFTFYDRTGIQKYLEKKAEEGWMLERLGGFSWKFRRIAPKKVHFAVTYFPKASAFDPAPSEQQELFREFCAHSGWNLVAFSAQLQIFCNEQESPVPIETDPEIELENIHKTSVKTYLPSYLLMIPAVILPFFNLSFVWKNDPIRLLSTNIYLFNIFSALICALLCGTELIGYFAWFTKAKKAAAEGEFVETKGRRNFQLALVVLMMICLGTLLLGGADIQVSVMMVTILVLIIGAVALSIGATKLMKRMNFSARKNRWITMAIIVVTSILACGLGTIGVVSAMNEWNPEAQNLPTYEFQGGTHVLYRDEIPLKVQDLTDVDPENYSYRLVSSDESFLLSRTDAYQRPRYDMLDQPDISYTIIEVKAEFFCDFVLDKLLETDRDFRSEDIYGNITYDEYRQVDASPWSADCAYQLCNGENAMSEYLLCYGNTFVILDPDWIPTQEQMERAGEILGK